MWDFAAFGQFKCEDCACSCIHVRLRASPFCPRPLNNRVAVGNLDNSTSKSGGGVLQRSPHGEGRSWRWRATRNATQLAYVSEVNARSEARGRHNKTRAGFLLISVPAPVLGQPLIWRVLPLFCFCVFPPQWFLFIVIAAAVTGPGSSRKVGNLFQVV